MQLGARRPRLRGSAGRCAFALAGLAVAFALGCANNGAHAAEIAYFSLAGNAIDSIGGHDGTIHGTVTPTTNQQGTAGDAMLFDGHSYISVGDYGLGSSTSATYSVWATLNAGFPNYPMLFNTDGGSPGPDLFIVDGNCSGSSTHIYWNTYDSCNNPFAVLPSDATDGNFHNYTTVLDGVANTASFYFDDTLIGTAAYRAPKDNLVIGGDTSGGFDWDGNINDVAIFNTALTSQQVASLTDSAPTSVPEPATLAVLIPGLLALAAARARRRGAR